MANSVTHLHCLMRTFTLSLDKTEEIVILLPNLRAGTSLQTDPEHLRA